jgi:hypothetical protein
MGWYVISIVIAAYLGVLTALHVLYRTRRIGYSWLEAFARVVAICASYGGLCLVVNYMAHEAGVDLGKDEHATLVIQGISASAAYIFYFRSLVAAVRKMWPGRKERAGSQHAQGPVALS